MNDTAPKPPRRNSPVMLPEGDPPFDKRMSIFANVAVNADRSVGKAPCFHEGMTLQDAVVITGLPEAEAARRLHQMKQAPDPAHYAVLHLGEGAGEQYRADPTTAPKEPAKVIRLQFWGNDYRAAPNAVFRSALFPALRANEKENRRVLKNEEIFCVAGLKIFFTGEEFDQSDLDVYLELLNRAQPFPLGTPVKFSAHSLLKVLGLHTGGKEHTHLHEVLIRLCAGVVDITDHGKRYFGQLLHGGIRDEITMNYSIKINPDFAVLFGLGMFAKIDLEQRRALGRNNTAKALHAYYSTHINPAAHDIETLCRVAGIRGKNRKATIIKAHDAMQAAGFLNGYEVAGDGIAVDKTNTPSQTRALLKKDAKPGKRRYQPAHIGDLFPGKPKK